MEFLTLSDAIHVSGGEGAESPRRVGGDLDERPERTLT